MKLAGILWGEKKVSLKFLFCLIPFESCNMTILPSMTWSPLFLLVFTLLVFIQESSMW